MKRHFMKKKEWLILLALVVVAAIAALLLPLLLGQGNRAIVYLDGAVVQRIDLGADGIYPIQAHLPVTLEVQDGRIRFRDSLCPDGLCEGFGFIGEAYEYAVCMPAGVTVIIEERS